MLAVNAHTHLYSGLAPFGMPAAAPTPSTFLEILERVWWRLDRALDASSLAASARVYVASAIEFGCAGLIDHHESPNLIEGSLDIIADACQELGMPSVLTYGCTERNGGREEAQRGLAECQRFIEGNRRPLCRGLVGVHAPFTVSDQTLRDAGELARRLEVGLHLHIAEDMTDGKDAIAKGYDGVVSRLEDNGALVPGSVFAHGVHLDAPEVERLAAAKIWLVQNPRSNANNGVGYPRHIARSSMVALGTDGFPADMSEEAAELRIAAEAAKDDVAAADRRLTTSQRLFEALYGQRLDEAPPRLESAVAMAIRAEAEARARELWQRMAAL